jgi:hypothetical protein
MIQPLEIHGTQPNVEGLVCEELIAEEYWHGGSLVSSANVVYFLVANIWHRLAIDGGIIFWRSVKEAPQSYQMPELQAEVRTINLGVQYGVKGITLDGIKTTPIESGSVVTLIFHGGKAVRVSNFNDTTNHSCEF